VHKFSSFCGFWWQFTRFPTNYAVVPTRNKEFAGLKWPMAYPCGAVSSQTGAELDAPLSPGENSNHEGEAGPFQSTVFISFVVDR
jgi:hypothetical protein